ncbi:hypothetical protein CTheo_2154 [Ceratobasidium theobromae]|uniref:Uncharacterized protein n=1 Tax=Ceratobasidium theobromae TaxID=1582974 RepID=A0A5N5QT24_9AGAM|nr:hypothetical protein CTheo_2154 [Ceratobasidium theobromae]
MVRLLLQLKAELENVTDLQPADPDNFDWFFKVKCNSCNEVHSKDVSMNRNEEVEVSGGKGSTANFVWRCGFCKRESSAKFEAASFAQPYTAESNGQWAPLVTVDCRGLEFVKFDPRGAWTCKGVDSGIVFSDVSLDGEWVDYDVKKARPVGITEIESKWDRAP